ncbi:MAG: sugar phosphate nucleotidyltransferase [Steroidobacterales bacterium]
MGTNINTWVLVLAAGEGTRLRPLTTFPSGKVIPKQFCSLRHGLMLLEEALCRARAVTSNAHLCAVVAEQHRRWWETALWSLPPDNVIVQPENRGTANGILLPLLHIAKRDPGARILILPTDHYVHKEAILAHSMRRALSRLLTHHDETVLLGLEPEECDPDLGYILPGGATTDGIAQVAQFVEKPSALQARELIARGGLWNAFIVASTVSALLGLFERRMGGIVDDMRAAVQQDLYAPSSGFAVAELYDHLPSLDFSRDILQGGDLNLRVLRVGQCGWSDLGTPERVARVLRRMPKGDELIGMYRGTSPMSLDVHAAGPGGVSAVSPLLSPSAT